MSGKTMAAVRGAVRSMYSVMMVTVLLFVATGAMAQGWSEWVGASEGDAIKYRGKFENGEITVEALLDVDPDAEDGSTFKTYALDNGERGGVSQNTTLVVSGGLNVTGAWTSSEVKALGDGEFGFKGTAWFRAPASVVAGIATATVTIEGMVCHAFGCFNPHEAVLTISLAAPKVDTPKSETPKTETPKVEAPKVIDANGADLELPTSWSAPINAPSNDDSLVRYRARLDRVDGKLTLVVEADHNKGWHTYAFDNHLKQGFSASTAITVSGALVADGAWKTSVEPTKVDLAVKNHKLYPDISLEEHKKAVGDTPWDYYFEGTVQFMLPVKRVAGETATLSITGMVCEENCFNFDDLPLTIAVVPGAGTTAVVPNAVPPKPRTSMRPPTGGGLYKDEVTGEWRLSQFAGATDGSDLTGGDDLWAFLVLCFFGGLVALLMPCVFPMIPITVSYFGKQAELRGGSTMGLGLVYSFGVVFSYTVLGSVLTAVYGAAGVSDFAGDWRVAVAIAILFLVFALSMFGMFELRLPYALQQKFNVQGKAGGGVFGSFLLGATFAVTSMACTVPVVGSIFALAADGNILKPLLGMIVFSGVVAAPFFVLAVIPGALKKLPRGGGWMNSVKVVFGFIELAAAAEFLGLARIIPREWVLAVWIACFLLSSAYLVGIFRGTHDAPNNGIGAIRMVFASLFLAVAMWLSTGIYGGNLGFIESFLINEIGWEKNVDLKPALAKAKAEGKPVYLDFTGSNCANCRLFEKGALDTEWGKASLEKFAKYALYTDSKPHGSGYVELTRKLFGYAGQPAYVVINAEGQITAWLADINTVLKAASPKDVFAEFVKTAEGQGFDWDFDKGFAPPVK